MPSLRLQRGRFTRAVVLATVAILLILLGSSRLRNNFINPGEISRPHSGGAFAALAATNHMSADCGACHSAAASGPSKLIHAAIHAKPGPLDLVHLATATPAEVTAIDVACEQCHVGRAFHQPNIAPISCKFCHQEHRGAVMPTTVDANCTFCHGDTSVMTAVSFWNDLPSDALPVRARSRRLTFSAPRPKTGFTAVIHHFADDHPQFRFVTDHWRDPNTLKFNHALHLTGATIPELPNGEKLDCAFCHQPDSAGVYFRPVNFENNCRVCHSLQFDPETPGLNLPHGNPDFVSAFLHSLPKQYTDFAARSGITGAKEQNSFVEAKLKHLKARVASGEDFERRVFFSDAMTGPPMEVGTVSGATRALYPGCAYCHEVKSNSQGKPEITKPLMFERWLAHGEFNHAKHASVTCAQCHQAAQSKDTADIILPGKESCVTCHSTRGGVADSCATCHVYHAPTVVTR